MPRAKANTNASHLRVRVLAGSTANGHRTCVILGIYVCLILTCDFV